MVAEPTDGTPVPTLGERLTGQGRALAARHLAAFPWSGPLAVVTHRAAAFDTAHEERFARVELDPHARRSPPPAVARPHRPDTAGPGDASPDAAVPVPLLDRSAPDAVAGVPGRPPEPAVRERLRNAVGPAADLLRVHDDPAADALAHSHGADAVTIGTDVHFRQGRYRPGEDRGFGLLVHEAGHVQAGVAPGAALRRATGPGRAEEERRATALEHGAGAGAARPGPWRAAPGPSGAATPTTGPAPASVDHDHATPMAAPVGRDVDTEPGVAPAAQLAAQLATLRRELVEDVLGDLRRRLRTEFERGG